MGALINSVIVLHLLYFVFVLGGFCALIIGMARGEKWILNPWFRITHFLSVAVVLFEDVLQIQCPLNVAQANLQSASGAQGSLDWLLHDTLAERTLDVIYWTIGFVSILLFFLRPVRVRR